MGKDKRIVQIKPVSKKRWHGKVGAQSFKKAEGMKALVDGNTGKYATGLTPKDIEVLQERGCRYNLDPVADPEKPHEFWDSAIARFKLPDESVFLKVDEDIIAFIRWKICLASRFVANSVEEYNEGKWPDAKWVIFDAAKALEAKASVVELRNNAIIAASKISQAKKCRIVNILSETDYSGYSNDHITVMLNDLIDINPEQVLTVIQKDDALTVAHDLLVKGMQSRVITKDGHRYMYQNSSIGVSEDDAILYLADTENQAFMQQIKKDIVKAS